MRFTITRSKWLRGEGSHRSVLLRKDGMQCCVGQMCSQLGVPDKVLYGTPTIQILFMRVPSNRPSPELFGPLVDPSISHQHDWVGKAYGLNDSVTCDEAQREKGLTDLATAHGHELVFVD